MSSGQPLFADLTAVLAAASLMVLAGLQKRRLERRPTPRPRRPHRFLRRR
jgi:hypothetical protein